MMIIICQLIDFIVTNTADQCRNKHFTLFWLIISPWQINQWYRSIALCFYLLKKTFDIILDLIVAEKSILTNIWIEWPHEKKISFSFLPFHGPSDSIHYCQQSCKDLLLLRCINRGFILVLISLQYIWSMS